jgi:predicted nucleotidyltransferase
MSLSVENIKATLAEALPQLQKKYPVKALALFGSATRKDFDPDKSDIDVLVELNGDMDWNYFDLCYDIQSLFPHKKVDIVSRGAIQEQYWQFIEKNLVYA